LLLYLFQATAPNKSVAADSKRPVDAFKQPHGFNPWFKGAIPICDRITSYAAGADARVRWN